jgi:hypothetical protein
MYRLNPLERNVLITTDEVIFHIQSDHTLDPRKIQNSIIIAEERLIRPALGYDFYASLIESKNLTITSGNKAAQQALIDAAQLDPKPKELEVGDIINASEYLSAENLALWKQYLWKLTAECVVMAAYPDAFVQFTSQGTIHKNPQSSPMSGEGAVTPDLRSIKWAIDKKMMDRIDPMMESMHLWLCKQQKADSTKYPDYCRPCDCNHNGVAYKRKTDIILGLYDDEDRHDRRNWRDPLHFNDCDC